MNLLALLERRPPPDIPPGIGRIHTPEDDDRAPKLAGEGPRENNRKVKRRENHENILAAIRAGLMFSKDIEERTGLCKTSVYNHCRLLAAEKLIRIAVSKGINTYHPINKKKSKRGIK